MPIEKYTQEQYIAAPIEKVWAFFSDINSLAVLTPPHIRLGIAHIDLPKEMHKGQKIVLKMAPLWGIRVKWHTIIADVITEELFADEQEKGPYKYWRHEHHFKKQGDGTLMTDVVRYQMPTIVPAFVTRWLGVREKLEAVFEYRRAKMNEMFNKKGMN